MTALRRLTPQLLGLALVLSFVLSTTAYAQKIYKWVDAQGRTHFGEQLPPSGDAESIAMPTSPAPVKITPETNSSRATSTATKEDWCDQDKELCELVQQADPKCRSSQCAAAKRIAGCTNAVCQAERLDVVNELTQKIKTQKATPSGYRSGFPGFESTVEPEYVELANKVPGLLTPAQAKELVQLCEANRGIDCRSTKYLYDKGRAAQARPWHRQP